MSHQKPPTRAVASPDDEDGLELPVIESDHDDPYTDTLTIDPELVIDSDFEHDVRHHRRFAKPKHTVRLKQLLQSVRGKGKGKYSQVEIGHHTESDRTVNTADINSDAASTNGHHAVSVSDSEEHDGGTTRTSGDRGGCLTLFNVVLFFAFVGVLLFAGFIGWIIGQRSARDSGHNRPKLIVVSFDGFRASYLTDESTKNLTSAFHSLIANGVSARRMVPVFPSQTFPNHWTLVTGLYSESHGIVANHFYDPQLNESFTKSYTESKWWNAAQTVWQTAALYNITSAVLNWPGSHLDDYSQNPTISAPYNDDISDNDRVSTLFDWLDNDQCQLCMIYISTIDSIGHVNGPQSSEMLAGLTVVNTVMQSLIDGLQSRRSLQYNLLIVSDHGMTSVDTSTQLLVLDSVLTDVSDWELVETGTNGHVRSLSSSPTHVDELIAAIQPLPNVARVTKRETRDPSYHYASSARIADIVVEMAPGWLITDTRHSRLSEKGAHGYNPNALDDMAAIFLLSGLSVRAEGRGTVLDHVRSVDMYALQCHLLGIPPAPTNGSLQSLAPYLHTR